MIEISKGKKTILLTVLILLSAVFLSTAESIWEGSAAMGRYGEFPFTGFYGASNSFPQNAYVEVENLENGKRTRLIIVDRLSNPGMLMLVSNEAAQELGIYQNDIVRIKVRIISNVNTAETPQFDDLAYNPDPDINPAAALMTPEELVTGDVGESRGIETAPPVSTEPEPEAPQAVEVQPPEAENVIAEAEPEPVSAPEVLQEPVPPEAAVTPEDIAAVQPPEVVETKSTVPEVSPPEAVATSVPEAEEELWPEGDAGRTVTEENEFPVLSELPPVTDGLSEAEALIREEDVPAGIAEDSPEKPFDWPESLRKPESEPEPEPLYLTMDDLEEGNPVSEEGKGAGDIHSPETEVLWPEKEGTAKTELAEKNLPPELTGDSLAFVSPGDFEDGVDSGTMKLPDSGLELLSSGLNDTEPAYAADDRFRISTIPDVVNKAAESDKEYLTDASDYHLPEVGESEVAVRGLPSPEPGIPEEVIAVLVGDHLELPDNEPDSEKMDTAYIDSPEITAVDDDKPFTEMLAEAEPEAAIDPVTALNVVPELSGGEESRLVDVANGYISPESPEFSGKIEDYPNAADAGKPVDLPSTDDELAYSEAPETETGEFPELTELPKVSEAAGVDSADTEEMAMAEPEYDENLEISLVPAEVRPPELIEDETGLLESEPEPGMTADEEIAGHAPEVEEPSVVESEPVKAPVEPTVAVETEIPPETEEVPGISKPETVAVESPAEPPVEKPAEETVTPPVEVAVAKPETVRAPERELTAPEQVMMVSKLQQQRHYLQLGAFKEKNSAIKAAGKLDATYPVTILTDEAPSGVTYKLLLGPLSADESGIMLYNFRAGGYSDAFIRRIE